MFTRRRVVTALATVTFAPIACKTIAQTAKLPRHVAILSWASADFFGKDVNAFQTALKSLGYAEGRNIVFDIRWAENRSERLPGRNSMCRRREGTVGSIPNWQWSNPQRTSRSTHRLTGALNVQPREA